MPVKPVTLLEIPARKASRRIVVVGATLHTIQEAEEFLGDLSLAVTEWKYKEWEDD